MKATTKNNWNNPYDLFNSWRKFGIVSFFKDGTNSAVGYDTKEQFLEGLKDFSESKSVNKIVAYQNINKCWKKY